MLTRRSSGEPNLRLFGKGSFSLNGKVHAEPSAIPVAPKSPRRLRRSLGRVVFRHLHLGGSMTRPRGGIHKARVLKVRPLRNLLKRVYKKLTQNGVPKSMLPTNDLQHPRHSE